MAQTFGASVDAWVRASKARMEAVHKTATQSVIDDAQTPVGKGGRMRVDTGFLRLSGQTSLEGMPTGPERPSEGFPKGEDANLVIGRARLGDTIYHGWTAAYARARESKDAFLGLATQKWQQYVDKAVAEAKRRVRGS